MVSQDVQDNASVQGLGWLFEQVESALTGDPLKLNLPDRIDPSNADPSHLAHRGIAVHIPTTENAGQYRDDVFALAHDRIEVSLTYRVRPTEQRKSRREAIDLEERIREVMMTVPPRELHMRYVGTTVRGPHPKSSEWFLITQAFTTQREVTLGD